MKTKEELNALKEEVEALNKKLAELSEDELKMVAGGEGFEPLPVGTWITTLFDSEGGQGVTISRITAWVNDGWEYEIQTYWLDSGVPNGERKIIHSHHVLRVEYNPPDWAIGLPL